jgi:hypothetical protein
LGETQYSEEYGRFRLHVSVEDLGVVPPEPTTEEPNWVLRTWADVVTGDEVRMPGTDVTATIAMRYRHPSEDPAGTSWHVVPATDTGPWAHTKDHFVQPGECVIQMADSHTARFMNPAAPVEIKLSPAEVAFIDSVGWHLRAKVGRS